MANALFDIGGNDGIGFSAGVGVGHAWAGRPVQRVATPGAWMVDEDHDWAWQAIAAVRIPVTEDAEIGLKYRYLNTKQFEMVDTFGRSNSFEIASHSAHGDLHRQSRRCGTAAARRRRLRLRLPAASAPAASAASSAGRAVQPGAVHRVLRLG